MFIHFGSVTDVFFLSKKSKRSTYTHYAFVHFLFVDAAQRAIDALNGEEINGNRLVVAEANMKKYASKLSL